MANHQKMNLAKKKRFLAQIFITPMFDVGVFIPCYTPLYSFFHGT
jgi:hypothetical protein